MGGPSKFIHSASLHPYVAVLFHNLSGLPPVDEFDQNLKKNYSPTVFNSNYELYVKATLYQFGTKLGCQVCTNHRFFQSLRTPQSVQTHEPNTFQFNEMIRIPIRYSDLHEDAKLAITVYAVACRPGETFDKGDRTKPYPVGSVTLPLFDRNRCLHHGRIRAKLHPGVEADGNYHSKTPYVDQGEPSQIELLEQRLMQGAPKPTGYNWLDRLVDKRVKRLRGKGHDIPSTGAWGATAEEKGLFLSLELPSFTCKVRYHEQLDVPISRLRVPSFYIVDDTLKFLSDNPVDKKNRKLLRSKNDRLADQRPSVEDQRLISKINRTPTIRLNDEQKEFLWRVRNHITQHKTLLPKFLRAVDWNDGVETEKAVQLMKKWEQIDTVDALDLLSLDFIKCPKVREHGITTMKLHCSTEEFGTYLPQLIYALRLEAENAFPSMLHKFIVQKSMEDFAHMNLVWWLVEVHSNRNQRYWESYERFSRFLEDELRKHRPTFWSEISRQKVFVGLLRNLGTQVRAMKGRSSDRTKQVRALIKTDQFKLLIRPTKPFRLPIRSDKVCTGVVPDKLVVCASAECPLIVVVSTKAGDGYRMLWKMGDDLRQDAQMMQVLRVVDSSLKQVNMDFELNPYHALATSVSEGGSGFIEMVPETNNVADVLKTMTIQDWIRKHNGKNFDKGMHRYIMSLAGYSVFTYILGIGDRHLDNLLLTKDGKLLHIDFGFVYGHEPNGIKAYAATPMKLIKEFIIAMDGRQSRLYQKFVNNASLCYNHLRKNSRLIVNLLKLMEEGEPEGQKNIEFVTTRLQLHLTDEEAAKYLEEIMEKSVTSVAQQALEWTHKIVTARR